ncbi:hypothetical protein L1987_76460 [Smallanthus sonchifolius]|uniref:Uncharacterized protein n=1 Tax=Smallanthus sonchifolius TaxID=185202 RepID=A0ACB8Z719_9ASTR|nr:hypothetical protein L1987_76460 [Smallanthus sonchifolius]
MNPSSSKRKRDLDSFDENNSKKPKNDVFINYSFDDIGKNFISHLQGALTRSSFTTSDHTSLPVGQDACLGLLKAIEESEIFVVVFSGNYASSMNEDPERVQKWRHALKEAGQLSGLTLQNRDEARFVSEIVEELEKMQSPQELHVTDYPVGIGSRAKELISTLRLDRKDHVLVVAVLGISGIGKTTIVRETYNRILANFEVSCFLADIHYLCQVPNWKTDLPKELISCLTKCDKFSIMGNHNESVTKIKRLVSRRKVLLVLDDVDNFQQLEALGINPAWFYNGSRIIVTTRDKRALGNIPYASYHTMLLSRRESLNLFTRLMFSRDDPVKTKFIEEVVSHSGGLPLVLKVWSCHFKQYEREEWRSILETLKRIPHGDVQKQLQMSYDSLTNRAKKLFLDIACFFDGEDKDLFVKVLQDEDSAFFPNYEFQYLVDKSLVEIMNDPGRRRMLMHDAIRGMGQEIVRQENEDEPGQRTRLWDERDVMRVLTECLGTESVESIKLFSILQQEVTLQSEALRKMSNLRLIYLYANLSFSDKMTTLSFKKLKFMEWVGFPFKSFDNIEMSNVVVLRMQVSKLETLWEGIKFLKKLRILDVRCSSSLTKTGDFYGLENLEELYFYLCENLRELHSSIGCLHKLAILDLTGCMMLKRIPWEKIPSLRELKLDKNSYTGLEADGVIDSFLASLESLTRLTNLRTLSMSGCSVSQVPSEIGNLVSLRELDLSENTFSSLPDSLSNLSQLVRLNISDCSELRLLPLLPLNLTYIEADECGSLDMMPFDSMRRSYIFRTKACKESHFTKQLDIKFSFKGERFPDWCSYQNWNGDLSFKAPMHLDKNICGVILCTRDLFGSTVLLLNKTKNTSVRFKEEIISDVMFYPLDVTTLVVEAGDTVVLEFYDDFGTGGGLRLIQDTDVMDSELVFQNSDEPTSPISSEMTPSTTAHLNDIPCDSSDSYDNDNDYGSDWDGDYSSDTDSEDELL